VINRLPPALRGLFVGQHLPDDIRVWLVAPLYGRMASLMLGHIAGLCVNLAVFARTGAVWAELSLLAGMVAMLARLTVLGVARRRKRIGGDPALLALTPWYCAVGVFWAVASGIFCGLCACVNDESTRLFASTLALGTGGGLASRNAGTPRFALIQVYAFLMPLAAVEAVRGGDLVFVGLMTTLYTVALRSIVWQHYADLVSQFVAKRASAEREAELQTIFANAAAGVTEVTADLGRFTRVNRVYCRMAGRPEAELLGERTIFDVVHPAERADLRQGLRAMAELHTVFDGERRYLRPDGTVLWVRISAAGSKYNADGQASHIVAVVHDVTERKAAEAALRESEEMLRLSMQVGGIHNYQRDYVTRRIYAGPEARLMHGLPMDGDSVAEADWLATLMPEDRARVAATLGAAQAARELYYGVQYRIQLPGDGSMRHIETRARIDYDADGRPQRSVGIAIDITERQRAAAQIAHLAHHDPLTNLPNRALFHTRLDEALARAQQGEAFALCYLDLDHFKEVNDTLGHPAGDALLRAVTERLCAEVRPSDTVARLGGDEFAVIQTHAEQPAGAIALAQRLIERLAAPFDLAGHQVTIGTSVGIAIAPGDGADTEQLLKNADLALYHAKEEGRGTLRLFNHAMNEAMIARRTLERDLRAAVEVGGFELFYQPLVEIETGGISGFEALIRWRHAERGLIRPDDFIPLAESNGLIVPIGAWVLREACAQAAAWPAHLHIAVNISVVAFASGDLVDTVARALAQSALAPHRLELEITETVMLQDTEPTLAILHRLKALGVRIVVDDFGAGFSSLRYMQKFPFDKVKIDRSFIAELGQERKSATIVRAVIDLCAALNMDTVAEGVETAEQLAALAAQGCKQAQGYYFSVPRPAHEIDALIALAQAA
jgi:diguanylate cyclase (GGDEF)-like protein/PAS domain S-box-containing protein